MNLNQTSSSGFPLHIAGFPLAVVFLTVAPDEEVPIVKVVALAQSSFAGCASSSFVKNKKIKHKMPVRAAVRNMVFQGFVIAKIFICSCLVYVIIPVFI